MCGLKYFKKGKQNVSLVHKSSQMDSLYSGNHSTAGDASPSLTSEDMWKNIYQEFLFSPHDSCLRARMKDQFDQGCKTKQDGRRAAYAQQATEGRCRGACDLIHTCFIAQSQKWEVAGATCWLFVEHAADRPDYCVLHGYVLSTFRRACKTTGSTAHLL